MFKGALKKSKCRGISYFLFFFGGFISIQAWSLIHAGQELDRADFKFSDGSFLGICLAFVLFHFFYAIFTHYLDPHILITAKSLTAILEMNKEELKAALDALKIEPNAGSPNKKAEEDKHVPIYVIK